MRGYVRGEGVVLEEPAVVAIDTRSARPVAIGRAAAEMVGRTPAYISIDAPLAGGALGDARLLRFAIEMILRQMSHKAIGRPRVALCIPGITTTLERRVAQEAARAAGASDVVLVPQPFAAATGASLSPSEPLGKMIVDFGGGSTQAAVVCMGVVAAQKAIRIGGAALDRSVTEYMRATHGMVIGPATAEELKLTLGAARFGEDEGTGAPATEREALVSGRDAMTGRTAEAFIGSREVCAAISGPLGEMLAVAESCLMEAPGGLAEDLLLGGIHLVGGGALLPGIADWLASSTQLPVKVVDQPGLAAVKGAGEWAATAAKRGSVAASALG